MTLLENLERELSRMEHKPERFSACRFARVQALLQRAKKRNSNLWKWRHSQQDKEV